MTLMSCKDKATNDASEVEKQEPPKLLNSTNQQSTTTAQSTSSAWHYTCSQGCAGGAAAAGTCSNCGQALVHNQAYHNNPNNTSSTTPVNPSAATSNPASTKKVESSQNSAGVWHYTCSQGCAGGAGSAVACASCGTTLAHNQAYHN